MPRINEKVIQEPRRKKEGMTKAEKWLVIGTLGICSGVWTTLGYLMYLNRF